MMWQPAILFTFTSLYSWYRGEARGPRAHASFIVLLAISSFMALAALLQGAVRLLAEIVAGG